jgi:tyrosine-protein kinase Etk/Wzc
MKQRTIPIINQQFDIFTFLKVLKKNIWIIGVNLLIGIIIGLVYLRYTPPTYQSSSVLQVRTQNKTNEILGIKDIHKKGLDPVIELLRSKEFLKRCFSMLPLEVSYYKQGTFLSHELYKASPFEVIHQISNEDLKNTKVYVHFNNSDIELSYKMGKKEHKYTLQPNQWKNVYGGRLKIKISDYDQIKFYQNQFKKAEYYFIINDNKSIIEQYSNNLRISILNSSAGTIKITFTDNNPRKTAEIVNTISSEFLKYDVEKKKEGANNILAYIDRQLGIVMNQLDSTEKNINAFQKKTEKPFDNGFFGQQQSYIMGIPTISSRLSELQKELINIEFEIYTLKQIVELIESERNVNIYELMAMLSGTRSESFVKKMLNSILDLYNERSILLNDVTEDNHKIKTIDKQIETKKDHIINFINSTLKQLESNKDNYENRINKIENRAFSDSDSTSHDLEHTRLKRLYSINENFYNQLIQKKAEYMISQAGYVSNNIILENATIPKNHIKPSKKSIFLFVILLAIFVSLLIILIRYLFYNKISTIQEISYFTDIPVIGAIPLLQQKKNIDSQLVVHKNPKSVLTEAFRNIRSNMQFVVDSSSSAIITISSTVSKEGKTFVAINLGGILAMANKKAILLDLDLRKPRLHKSFDIDNNKGISTILIGKHSIDECTHSTEIDNLDVIPSGPVPPNPSELMLTKRYNTMMDKLKETYDYIIIDTPPIGIVTDAIKSFQDADYAFYVIKADQSPRTFISYINNLADNKSLKNLSLILNGMDERSGKYGYGYGYHYGYSYGYGRTYGYREYVNGNEYYDDPTLRKHKRFKPKNPFKRKRGK